MAAVGLGRAALPAAACLWLAACAARGPAAPVVAASGPAPAAAAPVPAPAAVPRCDPTYPDSVLTVRDTIYLHGFLLDTTARGLLPQVDLVAQRVAYRLRLLLGGRTDSLPAGEPLVTWRSDIGGNLEVKAHGDGRATRLELLPMPLMDTVPTRLMARALDSVLARGEMVTWSREAPRDSVEMRFVLAHTPEPSYPRAIGSGFPVFTLRLPALTPVELVAHPVLRYPEGQRDAGIGGHVLLRVTIDSLGRPVPASIHDIYPADRPRPEGKELDDYLAFSDAAHEMLIAARYRPARLGGCPVSSTIDVPFDFSSSGRR